MKRFLFALMGSLLVIAGSVSGAVLQSGCVGLVAMVASDGNPAVTILASIVTFIAICVSPSSSGKYALVTFTEGICEKIQSSLTETFGQNAPSLKRTKLGYLEALTSPQNTSGMEQVRIDPGDGKERQVRLKYIQRGTSDDITTSRPAGCATEKEPTPKEQIVSITNELYTKGMKFNQAQMRKLCEGDQSYISAVMNSRLDPFMVELNKALLEDAAANFGAFYGGSSAVREVNLLKPTTNQVDYFGESSLLEDFEMLDAMGRPIVIGAELLSHYVRQIGIGCCNDGGQNLANAGHMDFFHDKYVRQKIGTNHFIALVPGHIQLMTFNENKGEYAQEGSTFSHGTFVDPKTGIELDMDWHYNDCDRFWSLHFGFKYEMYYLPGNAFTYGDDLYGFNGLLHYKATQV
jgi:hypothetical protein